MALRTRREAEPTTAFRVGPTTYVTNLFPLTPQAVTQAVEWRFMVRALYVGAGSPPVPGFTESQVDQVLWGESPADPEFFAALLRALSAPVRPQSLLPVGEDVQEPGFEPEQATDRALAHYREAVRMIRAADEFLPAARRPRLARPDYKGLGMGYLTSPRGFAPPDPESLSTVAEFLQGLKDLRTWAKLSLRDIEERTVKLAQEGEPVIWLPRATVSDVLRREKLPKREIIRAYVAACGLTQALAIRWLNAYDRLESLKTTTGIHGGPAALPASDEDAAASR